MPFPTTSPYEILELAPSATLKEIMRAYQAALRRKKYSPAQITHAFNELKNPRKRAGHDLLEIGQPSEPAALKASMAALPRPTFISAEQCPVRAPRFRDVVGALDVRADFVDVPGCPVELAVPPTRDAGEPPLPPIRFPA